MTRRRPPSRRTRGKPSFERQKSRERRRLLLGAVATLGAVAVFAGTILLGPQQDHSTETAPLSQQSPTATEIAADPSEDLPEHEVAEVSAEKADTGPIRARFALCGSATRITCVVDGDTFWLNREKVRIADIDAPEIGAPDCVSEYELGMEATYRLVELLNEGPFGLQRYDNRDRDFYGRLLRVVVRDGESVGGQLVAEGLARPWEGRRQPWCE